MTAARTWLARRAFRKSALPVQAARLVLDLSNPAEARAEWTADINRSGAAFPAAVMLRWEPATVVSVKARGELLQWKAAGPFLSLAVPAPMRSASRLQLSIGYRYVPGETGFVSVPYARTSRYPLEITVVRRPGEREVLPGRPIEDLQIRGLPARKWEALRNRNLHLHMLKDPAVRSTRRGLHDVVLMAPQELAEQSERFLQIAADLYQHACPQHLREQPRTFHMSVRPEWDDRRLHTPGLLFLAAEDVLHPDETRVRGVLGTEIAKEFRSEPMDEEQV